MTFSIFSKTCPDKSGPNDLDMKLTKEDYMRLPKERLAELLVERDMVETTPTIVPNTIPYIYPYVPWWDTVKYEIT